MRTRTTLGAAASALLMLAAAGCGSSSSGPKSLSAASSGADANSSAPTTPSASDSTPAQPVTTPTPAPSSTPSVDPGTLPQTKTMPTDTDPRFAAGVDALWQGIVDDNPQEALPFFFPKSAYLQVKAMSKANAASDYQNRLIGFYKLDIHAAHRLLGADAKSAKLVGVSVPARAAEWIPPGVEENKLSYYRVYGSRLTYTEDGRTKSFGLFSLISWRGQWYVVHFGPNPRPHPVGVVYQPRG